MVDMLMFSLITFTPKITYRRLENQLKQNEGEFIIVRIFDTPKCNLQIRINFLIPKSPQHPARSCKYKGKPKKDDHMTHPVQLRRDKA